MTRTTAAAWLLTAWSLDLSAQVALKANLEYRTAEARERAVTEMTHPVRPQVERTADLVRSLQLKPGSAIADIGSGAGYLIPYLRAEAGPAGSVIAVDIHADFVDLVSRKIAAQGWSNVRALRATERDPGLAGNSVDTAVMLDTYHHLDYPLDVLDKLRTALKPGGRMYVIDYYRSRKHPGASDADLRSHIRLDRDEVIREVEARRFRLVRGWDHLPHEYVLEFVRRD